MHLFILLLLLFIMVCILTGHVWILLYAGSRFLLLLSALLVLFFFICLVRLLFMKRKPAHFTRIDFKNEFSNYQVAFIRSGIRNIPAYSPKRGSSALSSIIPTENVTYI